MNVISDLILLLTTSKTNLNAQAIRKIVFQKKATIISFQFISINSNGCLNKNEFLNWHYQYGIDLSKIHDQFQLRDIILLRNSDLMPKSNFVLLHLWNWPESTYNIDSVRIPHPKKFDKRNNPLGKNPGNIWAFTPKLDDGKESIQLEPTLLDENKTVCQKQVELDALKRLIKCHSLEQDEVLYLAETADIEKIKLLIIGLHRKQRILSTGVPDPFTKRITKTTDYPFNKNKKADTIEAHGLPSSNPKAIYYFTDSRYGVANLIDELIDDVVTSPPYNIKYDPFNVPKPDPKSGKLVKPNKKGYKDDLPADLYNHLLKSVFKEIDQKLNPQSADVFINLKNNYSNGFCLPAFWILDLIPSSWQFTDLLIWRYDISYDPAKNKYKPYYEWIFRFSKGKAHLKPNHTYLRDYYLPILKGNSKEREGLKHPAIYPRKLVKICLNESSHRGLVLDPFLGSGTTLISAYEMERPSIGFEIDCEYKKDIEKQLTKII